MMSLLFQVVPVLVSVLKAAKRYVAPFLRYCRKINRKTHYYFTTREGKFFSRTCTRTCTKQSATKTYCDCKLKTCAHIFVFKLLIRLNNFVHGGFKFIERKLNVLVGA